VLDFLRNLLDPLFNLMGGTLSTFHGWGAPWWLAIVMLTIVVRALLFPITYRQVKSMRNMQDLKPDMDRIRADYKDDVQKQREVMAKLYKERQVNPLGGCLPIFVQLPIFLVLYYTIRHFDTLESFRTGGLLWFQNLTQPDHLFVLPVLYVLTMMASQELTIRNTATQQKQVMRFLPIIFGVFLARFPAGLFVYWVTSNLITFAQNYVIYYVLPHRPLDTEDNSPTDAEKKSTPTAELEKPAVTQGQKKSGRARNRKKKKVGKRK
jgi:YidC/Oxa1 family membrane protein insertase